MNIGTKKERDLVNYLNFNGFTAVRVTGSGGGTKNDRPDILAGNKGDIYVIELKSSSKDIVYLRKEQIKELYRFADGFGAVPVVAVKFTYLPYCFMSSKDLTVTKGGNYTFNREKARNFKNKFILT